jgi:lysophospholipase L1-like esterase
MAMRDSTLARFGQAAIDFWTGLADAEGRILPVFDCGDGIHLNDAGHRLLAERVVEAAIPDAVRARDSAPARGH